MTRRQRLSVAARRAGRLGASLVAAVVAASCSDRTSTAPGHDIFAGRSAIGVTLSDSAAAAGTMVLVSIDALAPQSTPSAAIAAFRARLAFDAGGLQYVDEAPGDAGVHAVNVVADTVRVAGVAPGAGFSDGRLVTFRFRVVDPAALRSLSLVADEIRDLTYADRRAEFMERQGGRVRITADVVPGGVTRVYGDATADGAIDASDALAILTKDVGLTPPAGFDSVAADVNVDGAINALDAQIVLSSLVGRDVSQFRLGDVVGSAQVTITAIAPDTLRPGVSTTITGTNFSETALHDTVTIDSVPAVVTAASTTQLTVTVPQAMPCRATHPAVVTVHTSGATGEAKQMLVMATRQTLQVGQSLIFDTNNGFRCNEFSSGEYFVAVYNSARETSPVMDTYQLVSTAAFGLDNMALANRVSPRAIANRLPPPFPWHRVPMGDRMRQRTVAHLQFMERDRQLAMNAKIGAVRRANGAGVNGDVRRLFNVIQTVGAYSTFYMRVPSSNPAVDSVITIRARTAYVGTHEVIVEDSLAPLAGQIDNYYRQLGTEFDNVMYPILLANFGNPLVMDASLSRVGRIVMLFTPAINTYFPNLEAFVTACDFLTPADCPGTNQTEMFYSTLPTRTTTTHPDGPGYDPATPPGWYNEIRGTLIHEAKHITAFGQKFSLSPRPLFEESWLEEGTAQIASELYGRTVSGATWKGGATYQQALNCEVYLCPGYGFTMVDHFGWLNDYEASNFSLSPINSGHVDPTIYGSAWLLTRWAADLYASTEPTFFKALIQQITTNGVANLEARTGQPWAKLLGEWAVAIAADHYNGLNNPPGIPSWNTRDVFFGLYNNLSGFNQPYPLYMPSYAAAPLSLPGTVAAGSAAFYDLTFPARQSIGVQATATTLLSDTTSLRLAVVRIQ